MGDYSFPQADNLEFIYQVFTEYPEDGFDRYSFGDRYPNQGTKLYSLISQCTKKINFQIINRDVNSFNFFKNIFERNGGKIYIIKTFDPNNDAGGYFTN